MSSLSQSTHELDFPSHDPYAPRKPGEKPYQREILWDVVVGMLILHIGTFYNFVQFYNGWRPPAAAVIFSELIKSHNNVLINHDRREN